MTLKRVNINNMQSRSVTADTHQGNVVAGVSNVVVHLGPVQALVPPEPFYQGSNYGYTMGGAGGTTVIDRYPYSSDGDASDAGELVTPPTIGLRQNRGHSSSTNGYSTGGFQSPSRSTYIGKFPFASSTGATFNADLQYAVAFHMTSSSETNGYAAGGFSNPSGQPGPHPDGGSLGTYRIKEIQKFPFSSDGDATDVADLTQDRAAGAGLSSREFGYSAGGRKDPSPAIVNVIDRWSHTSDANASDVGDLVGANEHVVGISATSVGYSAGGTPDATIIEKFSFASSGNATDVGTLTQGTQRGAASSSTVSGYITGGLDPSPASLDTIQKFPFAADSASTDVANLTQTRYDMAAAQF